MNSISPSSLTNQAAGIAAHQDIGSAAADVAGAQPQPHDEDRFGILRNDTFTAGLGNDILWTGEPTTAEKPGTGKIHFHDFSIMAKINKGSA